MDVYAVAVEGFDDLVDLENAPDKILLAAQRAINRVLETTRTASAREILKQVSLPARYVSGANGRLAVAKKARAKDLEGIIKGRERPTSLARFLKGAPKIGKAGVRVEVKPGSAQILPKAFVLRLPQGSTLTDTVFNLGLAVRLTEGEAMRNKKSVIRVGKGLYLLYGPSVNQVFRDVAEDQAEPAADRLEREFLRLLDL
jgi:hypothetical protein